MENSPESLEALREHFSRRASAARIASRTRKHPAPPKPDPDTPMTAPSQQGGP
jgi:hypothetical protein